MSSTGKKHWVKKTKMQIQFPYLQLNTYCILLIGFIFLIGVCKIIGVFLLLLFTLFFLIVRALLKNSILTADYFKTRRTAGSSNIFLNSSCCLVKSLWIYLVSVLFNVWVWTHSALLLISQMYSRKLGVEADTCCHSEGTPQAGGMNWEGLMKFKEGKYKNLQRCFPHPAPVSDSTDTNLWVKAQTQPNFRTFNAERHLLKENLLVSQPAQAYGEKLFSISLMNSFS